MTQYLLSYLLTAWSRVLLEKLTGFHLVMKFPIFYETRMFITKFKSARHPVTTARRVLKLRVEERPPIWREAEIILSKQLRTADMVCTSSLEVERGCNNLSSSKCVMLRIVHQNYRI